MSEYDRKIPIVALRGMAILPGMLIHFDINRPKSIEAVESAMDNNQMVLLLTQRDPDVEEPEQKDLYEIGTLAQIKQLIKLPGDILRVLVSGTERAKLESLEADKPYLIGEIEVLEDKTKGQLSNLEQEAMIRGLRDIFELYSIENTRIGKEVVKQILNAKGLQEMIDLIAINIPLNVEGKQILMAIKSIIS